jgi:hypothetical protein
MTEAAQKFDLDRDTNIKNDIDAQGKKWEVKRDRGRALYLARPNPDHERAVIPKQMEGLWTKIDLLRDQIKKYVVESWNHADAVAQKNERKRAAEAEQAKEAKKVKAKSDDNGSTKK